MTDGLDGEPVPDGLWPGDKGSLPESSRRALVQLVKGPYLAAEGNATGWEALLADRQAIEARLADLFLELVLDQEAGVAFVRGVVTNALAVPQVVRTQRLTFIQTALLLHLRQILVKAAPGERVIAGLDEVTDYLVVYQKSQGIDRAALGNRVSSAWEKMHTFGLLHRTSTEGRSEISPALRLVFGPEQIEQLTTEYQRLAAGNAGDPGTGSGHELEGEARDRVADAGEQEEP